MEKNNCPWCGAGISVTEKFCSQCGGPNPNYADILPQGLPITNIGERVFDYKRNLVKGTYYFDVPRLGTLRRLIVETPRILDSVTLIQDGSYVLVNVAPKSNQYIYTGEIFLQTLVLDLRLELKSKFEQEATITLEVDEVKQNYHGPVSGGQGPLASMVRALQGR